MLEGSPEHVDAGNHADIDSDGDGDDDQESE